MDHQQIVVVVGGQPERGEAAAILGVEVGAMLHQQRGDAVLLVCRRRAQGRVRFLEALAPVAGLYLRPPREKLTRPVSPPSQGGQTKPGPPIAAAPSLPRRV